MSNTIPSKKLPSTDWDWLEENGLWDRTTAAKWFTPLLEPELGLGVIERTKRLEIRLPNAQLGRTAEGLEGKNMIHLRGFGKLKKLLPPRTLNDEGLDHICNLGKLSELFLCSNSFTLEGMRNLPNLTKLKTLTFEWLPKGKEPFEILAKMPKLGFLEVHQTDATNEDLAPLMESNIKAINIGGKNMDGNALKYMGKIVSLEKLMLGHAQIQNITNDDLKHIQHLPNLTRLTLRLTKVTAEGLVNLEPLKSLKKLQLTREMSKSPEAKALKAKIPGLVIKDNA